MTAIPAPSPSFSRAHPGPIGPAPTPSSARRARPALQRRFMQLAQCRQRWSRGWIGGSVRSHDARGEREIAWAEFDAPTYLRRGIVIEGLPDWRGPSSTS